MSTEGRLRWILWIIALAGLWLRLEGLAYTWINSDEGIYWFVATRESWLGMWQEIARQAHPPLFYVLLRVLLAIFGANVFSVKIFLSVTSLLIVGLYAKIGWRVAGKLGAIAGAALSAFSPALISMSRLLRPYSIMLIFLSFAVFCFVEYCTAQSDRQRRVRAASNFGWSAAGACLFHYGAFLALLPMLAVLLIDRVRGHLDAILNPLLPFGLSLMFLVVTHLQPLAVYHPFANDYATWLQTYFIADSAAIPDYVAQFGAYTMGSSFGPALLLVAILAGLAVVVREWRYTLIIITPILSAVLLSLSQLYPFGPSRHSLYLLPLVWLALLLGIHWLAVGGLRRVFGAGLGIVAMMILTPAIFSTQAVSLMPKEEVLVVSDVAPVVGFIKSSSNAGARIIAMDPQAFFSLMPLFGMAQVEGRFSLYLGSDSLALVRGWYDGTIQPVARAEIESEWGSVLADVPAAVHGEQRYLVLSDGFHRSSWLDVSPTVFAELKAREVLRTRHMLVLQVAG
ncbi:MAG: glycosyltransferase family 39 protein [Oligoflexia bacterium]|nr:glycosyltransferase family 39 protein [Oligoflexia bacterium]